MIMKAIMDKKPARPPVGIVIKYFLLQLPGQVAFILILLLARQWLETPAYLLWGLLGFWMDKDIFLFPFLWRFYDPNQYPDRFQMAAAGFVFCIAQFLFSSGNNDEGETGLGNSQRAGGAGNQHNN